MVSQRYVALLITALLLVTPAFAAEKEAAEKRSALAEAIEKEIAEIRIAAAIKRALDRDLPSSYIANRRVSLLRNQKVREDLKLDEKQTAAIKTMIENLNAKRREIYAPIPGITRQERAKIIAEASKELQKYTAEQHKNIIEGLKAEQSKRLDQIVVQTQGIRALDDPKIAKELKITDEQKKNMAEARASFLRDRQLMADIFARTVDHTKHREKLQEIAKAIDQKVLDALSKEQQEQFEKMKGKKIELGRNAAIRGGGVFFLPVAPGEARGIRVEVVPAPIKLVPKEPVPKKP